MAVEKTFHLKGSNLSGYLAAIIVIFVWSSWLVASRAGATSTLTIFDLGAMRYGLSGLVALPIVAYYKPWRTISFWRAIWLSFFPRASLHVCRLWWLYLCASSSCRSFHEWVFTNYVTNFWFFCV